jgi:RNA polymerase sigma-70 factor (ECF subfamily)
MRLILFNIEPTHHVLFNIAFIRKPLRQIPERARPRWQVPTPPPALTPHWLESWLRRRLGNAWDAADLSQDTFLRVLASAQPIAQMQEPRAYLVTVGKRLLVNFHQRRSLEQAYLNALANLPHACVPSPEQRWLMLETLQALDELLDGLPVLVRRAFLWSKLEGLGYR